MARYTVEIQSASAIRYAIIGSLKKIKKTEELIKGSLEVKQAAIQKSGYRQIPPSHLLF